MEILIQIIITVVTAFISTVAAYFALRERLIKLETRYEVHVEKIQDIMVKLEKGSEAMGKLDDSINNLNVTLVELKTIINERK